jgi:hypothetical protein
MKTNQINFPRLVSLARSAGYNEENKAAFRKQSMASLRVIAKELQLLKGEFSISFNPGGIAVSGDATLHHNSFYLNIGDSGVFWRTCKGQKDYTGGRNRWVVGFGTNTPIDSLIREIQRDCFPAGFTHGAQGGAGHPWQPATCGIG